MRARVATQLGQIPIYLPVLRKLSWSTWLAGYSPTFILQSVTLLQLQDRRRRQSRSYQARLGLCTRAAMHFRPDATAALSHSSLTPLVFGRRETRRANSTARVRASALGCMPRRLYHHTAHTARVAWLGLRAILSLATPSATHTNWHRTNVAPPDFHLVYPRALSRCRLSTAAA